MDLNLNTQAGRTDAQLELETLAVEMGISRYRKALAEGGDAAVPAGMQLVKAAMGPMLETLRSWLDETGKGLASRNASLFYFVDQFEPEVVAWVTAQTCLSKLSERPGVAYAAGLLTMLLETQLNLEAIRAAQPKLAAKLDRKLQGMDAERNCALLVRRAGALADVKVVQWDQDTRVRVGTLLITMFCESTGLVVVHADYVGNGKTRNVLRPSESCRRWLEESHARCELLAPVRLPMVCRPRDWTNPFNGGYLTHQLRQPIVKSRNKGYLATLKEHQMPWVYASVNALQGTEWAVNKGVYEVVKSLWEASSTLGGLPSRDLDPLPARPWAEGEEPAPEVLHSWKVDAARTYEANAKAESKRMQVVQKLWVAEQMMERGNRFHYVYNLDWRGRMYPVGPALTPQGDDVAKAMLKFARASRLGDDGAYWLAIHGANTFGVDRVSFEERIQWVQDHELEIRACAQDPYVFRMWANADSPYCFLAFCFEWAALDDWVRAGNAQEDFESALPVAFDGSCNGLQNFSAMLRDPVGGKATGLIPAEKPADIYTAVKEAAQRIVDRDALAGDEVAQRWVGKLQRKHAKRNTMTVPYGVTKRGMRDQLFAELQDSLPEHRAADAEYLATCNYEAIGNVVVAARQAMDWLREAAKVAASTGLPVKWTTPAGLLVVQDYRKEIGTVLDFVVMGRRWRLLIEKEGDQLSPRRQALGISPNFVHSLDAAHLMRTVLFCAADGMSEFAMIHDSYGCPAGQAGRLRDNLREAFIEQYSQPVLEQFRDELLEQLPPELHGEVPPLPPMGALDLQQVRNSEYFFA